MSQLPRRRTGRKIFYMHFQSSAIRQCSTQDLINSRECCCGDVNIFWLLLAMSQCPISVRTRRFGRKGGKIDRSGAVFQSKCKFVLRVKSCIDIPEDLFLMRCSFHQQFRKLCCRHAKKLWTTNGQTCESLLQGIRTEGCNPRSQRDGNQKLKRRRSDAIRNYYDRK